MNADSFTADLRQALDDAAIGYSSTYPPSYTAGSAAFTDEALASAIRRAMSEHAIYRPRPVRVTVEILAGESEYALPDGFLRPEVESLSRALGEVERVPGYRDGAFRVASRMSGVPFGMRAGWSGGGYPYPPPVVGAVSMVSALTLTFREEDPPKLLVDPTPTVASSLTFDGLFPHSVATCPEVDRAPLIHLARACCLEARARSLGSQGKWSEGDVSEDQAAGAKSLLDQAEAARAEYKRMIHMRPIVVTG